jgi:hypothetical protein
MKILKAVLLLMVATWALPASATFVLFDDFQSYTTGNFNAGGSTAQAVWKIRQGDATVIPNSGLVEVRNDGTTQHLGFGWGGGQRGVYRPAPPIVEGDIATYYFRVRSQDATPDVSYGLSDQALPTNASPQGFGDFEVQIALVDDGDTGNNLFRMVGRNGGVLQELATGLSPNTWYDIWAVVNNATDTYNVYFGTTGDPNQLGALVGTGLGFRNGPATNDLITFMTLTGNGGTADRQAHLNNIYFNSEAVPEPASLAAACIGMLLLSVYRNRS